MATSRFSRRSFMKHTVAAVSAPLVAQTGRRPPNFVVIFADDLGYGDLACYGSTVNETPHLDRMAKEGARFTNFYVPMPYCAPSRTTLLTGRYPFRSGMTTNPAPDSGINDVGLPPDEITIAEALKPVGYTSICIGKWHLGHLPKFLPRTQGFDEYYGILYSNDMRPVQIVHNESVAQYPVVQANLTRDYTKKAVDFIEKNKTKPFFLYLPHAMPHKPVAASEEFYSAGRKPLYADVIKELDWSVGQILKALQDRGLDENTLVIFSSDNGPWYGGSTAGLRGMKSSGWDGGTNVPLIARWPGRIPAAVEQKEVVSSIDIFPTICKLAGARIPTDRTIDGLDIFPLMQSASVKSPHEAIFAMQGPLLHWVRSGKWKLHVRKAVGSQGPMEAAQVANWVDPRGPDGVTLIAPFEQAKPSQYPGVHSGDPAKEMMLFDLEQDRAEQKDVAAQHPDVVARLKSMFDKMDAEVAKVPQQRGDGSAGIMRLTGGALQYDNAPAAAPAIRTAKPKTRAR